MHDEFEEFPLLVDKETPPDDKTRKLMATLNDKKDYVIFLHMLKFILDKGLVLDKIHSIIYAEQRAFMKPFIELNNEKRTESSINDDQIGVQCYKKSSNSTFGKQIENPDRDKYRNLYPVNDPMIGKKLASKCTFKEVHILDEDLGLYEIRKGSVLYDKPIQIGFAILDICKVIVNELYYILKKQFKKVIVY